MAVPPRCVVPEILDELPPHDPRAIRSRHDLRRVHRAMRSVTILKRTLARLELAAPPRRIIELGGGDGSLMLRLARAWRLPDVRLTILDRQDIVAEATLRAFREVGWSVSIAATDVTDWARGPAGPAYDLCVTSLFLHHFADAALRALLVSLASRSNAVVACEPRRSVAGRWGARLIGILGANSVTREDAVTSVAAGFTAHEISDLWPSPAGWRIDERLAPPFTHCFSAVRMSARAPDPA